MKILIPCSDHISDCKCHVCIENELPYELEPNDSVTYNWGNGLRDSVSTNPPINEDDAVETFEGLYKQGYTLNTIEIRPNDMETFIQQNEAILSALSYNINYIKDNKCLEIERGDLDQIICHYHGSD